MNARSPSAAASALPATKSSHPSRARPMRVRLLPRPASAIARRLASSSGRSASAAVKCWSASTCRCSPNASAPSLRRASAASSRCPEAAAWRARFHALNRDWNGRVAAAIAAHRARLAGRRVSDAPAAALLPTAYALNGMVDELLAQVYAAQKK